MKIEKVIEITQKQIEALKIELITFVTQEYISCYKLAIEVKGIALQALQEKLEREKGCEYCNTEKSFTKNGLSIISKPYLQIYIAKKPLENKFYLMTSEYKELSNIKEKYSNNPFRSDMVEIDYCPHCGRKLGGENV